MPSGQMGFRITRSLFPVGGWLLPLTRSIKVQACLARDNRGLAACVKGDKTNGCFYWSVGVQGRLTEVLWSVHVSFSVPYSSCLCDFLGAFCTTLWDPWVFKQPFLRTLGGGRPGVGKAPLFVLVNLSFYYILRDVETVLEKKKERM